MTDTSARGRLAGRRIAIVGGASGIGRATVELFAAEGANVAVLDRQEEAARQIAAEVGSAASAISVDVTDEASVERAMALTVEKLGGLDGLVNSAGIVVLGSIEQTSLEIWKRHVDVNLTGTFLVCRAALPHLRAATAATIVNIASAQALHPASAASAYAASKGGVVTLTKAIAMEAAPTVRANVVCPGLVDTPMHDPLRTDASSPPPVPLDKYPLRRWASAREIADTILFLTSSESAYVTGITLAADGGRTFH